MSASVIRRGMELFSEKGGGKAKQKKSSSGAPLGQSGTDKQRVHRRIRQPQRPGRSARSTNSVKDKRIRSAVDEFRKKQKKSQMRSNLQYFMNTSGKNTSSCAETAAQRRSGGPVRPQPAPSASGAQEKSVFTEKDFQKFQQEYFSNL